MSEDKKNKKTLSLKLGAKRNFAPVNSFETGKTVIVEKKRLRRNNPAPIQNKDSLEHFAREHYGHKKENETIFIIDTKGLQEIPK